MKNISSLRTICFLTIIGLFLLSRRSYGQDVEKGQIEATGQVGFVAGSINTHGAFGGSVAGALSENVFVYGEFLFIPLGSSNVSILGVNTSVSAKGYNFDAGIHYQFRKYGSIVPYGNVGLGFLHSSASISNTFSLNGLNFSTGGSSTDFYANLGGGVRYYVTPQWGFRPELTVFAGTSTFVRIGTGVFYQFR
jgi:hypothetical protein